MSYIAFASLLGNRLWVHHFVVLIPVIYLFVAVMWSSTPRVLMSSGALLGSNIVPRAFVFVAVIGIAYNVYQQDVFFSHLEHSGGVGKSSSALTNLAEDAMASPRVPLYVFPDWGFFMPFAVVTGNRVPYALEADEVKLQKYLSDYSDVRVVLWSQSELKRYTAMLSSIAPDRYLGAKTYYQRDGRPAFYMLASGSIPGF